MKTKEDILNNLISDKKTNWKDKAKFRKDNKAWLDKSAVIALKILNSLKENGISQKQLAEKIGVSPQFINKLVKGKENLTLQTITNIETALGITLIELESFAKTSNYYPDYEVKESVVAFVDILGYKEIIHSCNNDIQQLNKKLLELLRILVPSFTDIKNNTNKSHNKMLKTFSDCFVISWTIKNNKSDIEIGETIKDLVDFQFNLSAEGFFLRGGISISNNYIDDNIIFGNGIINSYKLESEIAKYPRIILDKYAKEAVNKSIQKTKEHTDKEFIFFAKFIAIDQVDKQYFINYLSYVLPTNHKEEAYYMLEKHKVMIENKLISSYGDCPNIFRKYKWLAQYHNSFCKKHFNNKPNLIINNLINNHNRFQELSEIL